MQYTLLPIAFFVGGLIAWVDSRPNWDDTGVTALAILTSSGIFGYLGSKRPWFWALAVGLWIPILGIVLHRNFSSLLALAFAFVGAYAGAFIRTSVKPVRPAEQ